MPLARFTASLLPLRSRPRPAPELLSSLCLPTISPPHHTSVPFRVVGCGPESIRRRGRIGLLSDPRLLLLALLASPARRKRPLFSSYASVLIAPPLLEHQRPLLPVLAVAGASRAVEVRQCMWALHCLLQVERLMNGTLLANMTTLRLTRKPKFNRSFTMSLNLTSSMVQLPWRHRCSGAVFKSDLGC